MKAKTIIVLILAISQLTFGQEITEVGPTVITVSNLNKIKPFYEEVLSFKTVEEKTYKGSELNKLFGLRGEEISIRLVSMQLGEEQIQLMDFIGEETGKPIRSDARSNDLWFQHIAIVTSDMEKTYQDLRKQKVKHVSTAPQTLPDYIPAAAGIKAFYFRDPDGHNLEVIYFPKGKGNTKWQKTANKPLMGIDHSAIGISDTEQSLKFYQQLLGLKVAGNSENYGPEQEHLNQVFGARLLITGLHAPKGIGVEFLDYIAPPGGRKYPADSRVSDLWHWHFTMKVRGIEQLYQKMQHANVRMISSGIVTMKELGLSYDKAFMARDPDGHAILFIE